MTKALVIFGATGGLAAKMLLPSIYSLDMDGLLAEGLAIVGTARGEVDFPAKAKEAVKERAGDQFKEEVWTRFAKRLSYVAGDVTTDALYAALPKSDETVFYLAVSPDFFGAIARGL